MEIVKDIDPTQEAINTKEAQNEQDLVEFYKSEDLILNDYQSTPSYIINYKFLNHIQSTIFTEEPLYEPPLSLQWYPFCNSYYNYTEDVDFVNRVNNFLTNQPSFDSLKSVQKIEDVSDEDPYSIKDSHIKFLNSHPVCFLIFGKPGIGESDVARLLADDWKCCYIDPKILIEDEIEANTRVGQCIEFNLRCGRAIGVNVILRLLNKRINSQTAQHRGFVISGFPLIANDLYEEDPVSSESAVFTVHEIFEEIFDASLEIGIAPQVLKHVSMASRASKDESGVDEEEEEEDLLEIDPAEMEGEDKVENKEKVAQIPAAKLTVRDLGSADLKICSYDEIGTSYEDQIAYIFSLCNMPFLLIYISCPNGDVVEKRFNNRFDIATKEVTNLQRAKAEKVVYTVFTKDPNIKPENLDKVDQEFVLTSFDNNMILPYDFPANVSTTLEVYRLQILRHIENMALIHDPQHFIKLDGRHFANHMFNVLRTKIATLPIHYVVVPSDMNEPPDVLETEDAVEAFDPDMHTLEECFNQFHNKMIVGKMYKWSLSDWGYQCPVALADGRYENGLGKYAVHFMNNIYFLSDEEAHTKFNRNPRKYLTPPYPKPNCKIFVIGPKHSGKTAVSKCLAYLLNGHYICPKQIEADYMKRKQSELEDMIRSIAINEALSILKDEHQLKYEEMENKRLSDMDNFIISFEDDITRYENLIQEYKVLIQETDERNSFAIAMKKQLAPSEVIRKDQIEFEIQDIKSHFTRTFTLSVEDNELRRKVLANEFDINTIIPEKLTTPIKLTDEVFDVHHPFVVDYVRRALADSKILSIEMQTNLLKDVFRNALTDIETTNADMGIVCGGWVIDGMPINLELFDSLKPDLIADDIIVLRDNIDHSFLLERFFYKGRNDFNDYRTFFMELGKCDAAWRSPTVIDTDSFKVRLVQRVIDELLDTGEAEGSHEIDYRAEYFSRHPTRALIKQYEEHLNSFEESYENFIQYIADYGKDIIELDITNKEIPTLLKEVVKLMDDKYTQEVHVQTPEDKIQEMEDFGGDQTMLGEDVMGEEDINEEGAQTVDTFTINRRLGDTNNYCPVAFHDFKVLWKGKEELSVSFRKKIYFFSSEEAMNLFIDDPNKYVPNTRPTKLPPARISIIGVPGSGKKTMAKLLRQNYGLYCFDFEYYLKNVVNPASFDGYINEDVAIPEEILNEILLMNFMQEPLKTNGLILCGFPRRPSDVAFMVKHGIIPDIIIELSCLQMNVYNRRMDKLIIDWKTKMELDQKLQDKLKRQMFEEWEENRNARLKELVNLKRDERYFNRSREDGEENVAALDDKISIDSVQDAQDMNEIIRTLDFELPEPILQDNWETLEEAIQRFETEITQSYETEITFNAALREACEIEQIPWSLVDANLPSKSVLNQILRVTDHIKFRNESTLERCYDVTVETAERLMQNGYHFISRFGRTCPVQIFEENNFIQLFSILQGSFEIFPIIYRNYIYFLAGRKNRQKFIDNPIKYNLQKYKKFPLVPIRLAIIGPPKSGKTTIAERFQRDLGLKALSVGKAARYVLKTLNYTKLAKDIQCVLRKGWELTPEMAANCIRAMISDGKCITQGFVLDGFPNNREEAKHLAELGIIPHLILDIEAPLDDVMRCLNLDKGKNNLPRFSKKFINFRFREYQQDCAAFRKWIDKEYQNITKIHITPCKWGVWNEAFQITTAAVSEIKHYYRNAGKDMALNLSYMLVTPLEFLERQHPNFMNYCPACQQIAKYTDGGDPPDRTGLVQYKEFFYWVCPQHIYDFRNTPEIFLPPWNPTKISENRPKMLHLLEAPNKVYNQGYCVVCFADNLPQRQMEVGTLDYACELYGNTYLFDTKECLLKFMAEPLFYFSKSNEITEPIYPPLTLKSLPPLGLLEQYVSKQLIKAVTNVSLRRPIVPGLTISQSAVIYTGIFLKLNNPKTTPEDLIIYKRAQKLFDEKTKIIIEEIEFRKKYLNPYLWYEEPLPEKIPDEEKSESYKESKEFVPPVSSSDISMIHLIDEMLNKMHFTSSNNSVHI